jgi:hypothetical protein
LAACPPWLVAPASNHAHRVADWHLTGAGCAYDADPWHWNAITIGYRLLVLFNIVSVHIRLIPYQDLSNLSSSSCLLQRIGHVGWEWRDHISVQWWR